MDPSSNSSGGKNIDVAFVAPPEDTERLEDDERNYKNNAHSLPAGVVGSDSNYVSYYDAASLYPSSGKLASLPPSCARACLKKSNAVSPRFYFFPPALALKTPPIARCSAPLTTPPLRPLFLGADGRGGVAKGEPTPLARAGGGAAASLCFLLFEEEEEEEKQKNLTYFSFLPPLSQNSPTCRW